MTSPASRLPLELIESILHGSLQPYSSTPMATLISTFLSLTRLNRTFCAAYLSNEHNYLSTITRLLLTPFASLRLLSLGTITSACPLGPLSEKAERRKHATKIAVAQKATYESLGPEAWFRALTVCELRTILHTRSKLHQIMRVEQVCVGRPAKPDLTVFPRIREWMSNPKLRVRFLEFFFFFEGPAAVVEDPVVRHELGMQTIKYLGYYNWMRVSVFRYLCRRAAGCLPGSMWAIGERAVAWPGVLLKPPGLQAVENFLKEAYGIGLFDFEKGREMLPITSLGYVLPALSEIAGVVVQELGLDGLHAFFTSPKDSTRDELIRSLFSILGTIPVRHPNSSALSEYHRKNDWQYLTGWAKRDKAVIYKQGREAHVRFLMPGSQNKERMVMRRWKAAGRCASLEEWLEKGKVSREPGMVHLPFSLERTWVGYE